MQLHQIYNPITAAPFRHDETYVEILPCKELSPYIKCFWGSPKPYWERKKNVQNIVIPDTCMDIIFYVDYTDNKLTGFFRGIDERTFCANGIGEEKLVSTFAVRFYPWSVCLFAEDSLANTKNLSVDLDFHFSKFKKRIAPLLFDISDITKRIQFAQKYFLENISCRTNSLLMNSFAEILKRRGNIKTSDLAGNVYISNRQLERVFNENIGISPKKLSALIRYQYLWQDIVCKKSFNVLDAAFRYGYTDQSHLLREFKIRHSMTIIEAKKFALQK